MEALLRTERMESPLDLEGPGKIGSSSTVPEDVSVEILAENSISIDYPPSQEPGNDVLWGESQLTVVIIFQMIFLIILCLFGTCINSLVFWIFNRRPALRSLSNRFVLSLVTANLFISSIVSPLILLGTVLNHYLPFSCIPEALTTIANSVIFSAIFSSVLIGTDRYYAVTSPLHYSMTITRSRSQVMIVLAWLSGILLSLPRVLVCIFLAESSFQQSLHIISAGLQLSLGFTFPFLGLCWLYWRMYTAAHRNSERTRKHSISGELLTVMDGSTSVVPQGIDFLTHYMNPFSKTPMAGSAIPTGPTTATGVIVSVKKNRRRSSNGSSSSLLFREEGRAVKTAFFVLATFLLCWSPHFGLLLATELSSTSATSSRQSLDLNYTYGNWDQFFSVSGMLLSSLLHPFIYVFRNKMAWKELSKLLCGFLIEQKRKQDLIKYSHNNNHYQATSRPSHCQRYEPSEESGVPLHSPPSILPKSPRRSSMKSLTPQSSLNSNSTHLNLTTHSSNDSSSSTDSPIMLIGPELHMKPPFLRSLTLPEQPRVKFPPNLVRQKSYVQRTVSGPAVDTNHQRSAKSKYSDSGIGICQGSTASTQSRRSTLVRQDSICSILSTDSVLMICAEDGLTSASDIRLCSNSHRIRTAGASRRQTRMDDLLQNPYQSSSIEDDKVVSRLLKTGGNGKSCEPVASGTNTWSHMTQIPVLPSCFRQDSNFSTTTMDSGIIVGPNFGRQSSGRGVTAGESLEAPGHQDTVPLLPISKVSSMPSDHRHQLQNHQRFSPRSHTASTDSVPELPMLLQTSI